MMGAPINPSDLNAIQGTYPIPLTEANIVEESNLNRHGAASKIPGFEGIGRIVELGTKAGSKSNLKVGDWVLPAKGGFGTWRTHAIVSHCEVIRLGSKNGLSVKEAATIGVNPCSALRMLKDFASLKPGDLVVQNASNSAVGQAVIQLAKHFGISTINIIRDRPNFDEVASYLKTLGADHVLREGTKELRSLSKSLHQRPKLGLNAVGGASATELARALDDGGILVSYGGMSREPVVIPSSLFIFKDLSLRGFWLTKWKSLASVHEHEGMLSQLVDLIANDHLKSPIIDEITFPREGAPLVEVVEAEQRLISAVSAASTPFLGKKTLITFV
jgi:trans-2-enoyl-CoA reductase